MGWWHKITKTWIALSARIKLRKSRISGGRVGGTGEYTGDCGGISGGLLKLRDDVQMCGYRDVEVMWNMLNVSLQHDQMEAARSSNNAEFRKRGCKQRSISRVLFWTSHSVN
ncbi:uncharacterized protein LOC114179702 [Vigna unguiculata]|uniref:Uncharacterized protein n=1 Tax=Vigna unguiculata TaxID=3917 RepID=A0A4D6KXP4_VIGUN|nr:uncharacterized protein LOC114179702 [Vigna unguiculata]QCD80299.1 hypothetical protein DEO72_LG2g620 [Vigna unguiculata]